MFRFPGAAPGLPPNLGCREHGSRPRRRSCGLDQARRGADLALAISSIPATLGGVLVPREGALHESVEAAE